MKVFSSLVQRGLTVLSIILILCSTAYAMELGPGGSLTVDFTGFDASGFDPEPAAGQLDSDDWAVVLAAGVELGYGEMANSLVNTPFAGGKEIMTVLVGDEGGIYYYDTGTVNGTAMAINPKGVFKPGTITLKVTNNTGGTLNGLDLGYEVYFYNGSAVKEASLMFSYSMDGQSYIPVAGTLETSLTTGVWSMAGVQASLTGLSMAQGEDIHLRFGGNSAHKDEYIALDNIAMTKSGSANRAPSAPVLHVLYNGIADGAAMVNAVAPDTITFEWEGSTDQDGDALGYEVYAVLNTGYLIANMSASGPLNQTTLTAFLEAHRDVMTAFGSGAGVALIGMALGGSLGRGRRLLALILAVLLISVSIFAGCGGGGGGGVTPNGGVGTIPPGGGPDMSFVYNSLDYAPPPIVNGAAAPAPLYRWMVVADDGNGGRAASGLWSFSTLAP
jgi:hypothetical protein